MIRFTKADLESESGIQKLHQMLWSRCKAGKISQTEYMALLENRDVNLKRLIAEKNLTLEEARKVRKLVMDYRLTVTVAVDVAKERISLSQAIKASVRQISRIAKDKKLAPKQMRQKTELRQTPKEKQTKNQKVRNKIKIGPEKRDNPPNESEEKKYGRKERSVSASLSKRNFDQVASKQEINQKTSTRPENNKRKSSRLQGKNTSQQQRKHSRWQLKREYRENIGEREVSESNAAQFYVQEIHQSDVYPYSEPPSKKEESIYDRFAHEEESSVRQWRDWREERNIQLRDQKKLPPIPEGQDWYPGMGFRPAEAGFSTNASQPAEHKSGEYTPDEHPIPPGALHYMDEGDSWRENHPVREVGREGRLHHHERGERRRFEARRRKEEGQTNYQFRKDPKAKPPEVRDGKTSMGSQEYVDSRAPKGPVTAGKKLIRIYNKVRRFVPRKKNIIH